MVININNRDDEFSPLICQTGAIGQVAEEVVGEGGRRRMVGNWVAVCAILGWPVVAIILYRVLPFVEATLWTILGGFLMLPAGVSVKLQMIPALDKNSIPGLCALIAYVAFAPKLRRSSSGWGVAEVLTLLLIMSPLVTSALNNDAIIVGDHILPGVDYYDGISALLSHVFVILPFVIGRRVFREAEDIETLIRSLVIAGLFYSLPMLLEVRMSPQLANWIYGYSTAFNVEMRYGGFRPVVFMKNGLTAAFFLMTSTLSAVALWRTGRRIFSWSTGLCSVFLGVVLILCKSAGALLYAVIGGFFVRWLRPKALTTVALVLVFIGLFYPIFRVMDVFPDTFLVETASNLSDQRAASLKFRFDQERQLLDRAYQRFAFGWGRYGRSRVYDEEGDDRSITDGAWIQVLGQFGIVGFVAQFGLLAWPVLRAFHAFKFLRREPGQIFLATLSLIVALDVIEQLPNSSISSWIWFLAGVLLGRSEQIMQSSSRVRPRRVPDSQPPAEAAYPHALFQRDRRNDRIS